MRLMANCWEPRRERQHCSFFLLSSEIIIMIVWSRKWDVRVLGSHFILPFATWHRNRRCNKVLWEFAGGSGGISVPHITQPQCWYVINQGQSFFVVVRLRWFLSFGRREFTTKISRCPMIFVTSWHLTNGSVTHKEMVGEDVSFISQMGKPSSKCALTSVESQG